MFLVWKSHHHCFVPSILSALSPLPLPTLLMCVCVCNGFCVSYLTPHLCVSPLFFLCVSLLSAQTSEGQLRFEFENHVHTVIFSRKQMVRVRGTEFGVGNRVLFCLAATMPNNAAQSSDPPLRACVVASCPQDPYLKMEFLQKLSTESSKVCRLKWLDSMLEDVLGRPFDGEISVFSRVPGSVLGVPPCPKLYPRAWLPLDSIVILITSSPSLSMFPRTARRVKSLSTLTLVASPFVCEHSSTNPSFCTDSRNASVIIVKERRCAGDLPRWHDMGSPSYILHTNNTCCCCWVHPSLVSLSRNLSPLSLPPPSPSLNR